MIKDGFFVCLSSAASKQAHHPTNNAGDFTNELALPLDLDDSKNWEMGLCQISLPFVGKNQLSAKLLEEASKSREDADTTLKFAEELARDGQQLKLAAAEELKKAMAEKAYVEAERAKNESARVELATLKERIDRDREFLHYLNIDLDSKQQHQLRSAEEHQKQRSDLESGLTRLTQRSNEQSEVEEAQRRALEEQLKDLKKREEDLLREMEQTANQAAALKKSRDQLNLENQEAQSNIQKAQRLKEELEMRYETFTKLQESFQNIMQDFQTVKKSIPCVPTVPRRTVGDTNSIVFDSFSKHPINFPVKNFESVDALFNSIHSSLPSVWRSVFALELRKEALRIIASYPDRGLVTTYQACTTYAHDRAVNRLNGYQYAICFKHRPYSNIEDLVQAITVIGCYTYDMARKVAWDIIGHTDRLSPHISIRITPSKIVHIPATVYPSISSFHDKILRQLTTAEELLEYGRAVLFSVNDDEISPSSTVPDLTKVGIRVGLTVYNMEILLPPMIYENIRALVSFMRGAAPSQPTLGYMLREWRKLCHPLVYQARKKRATAEQQRYRSPGHILVQSDVLELTRLGSGLTPLLRVLSYPLESEHTHINFDSVQYFPVRPRWFNSIRILLTTSDGNLFSDSLFDGDCMVVVHIRPRDGSAYPILSSAGER